MKVLILSCNTGTGHASVANALQEQLAKGNIRTDIVNALDFLPKASKAIIEQGHSLMYTLVPKVYGVLYKLEEKKKNVRMLEKNIKKHSPKLARYIKENGYNVAICVHAFAASMLTAARHSKRLNIKQYFVATDYTCSPGVERLDMDAIFVPVGVKPEFLSCGIDPEKIVETGIPVSSWCYRTEDKAEAKRALGLREDLPLLIIGAGSIGCGPIFELASRLRELYPEKYTVAVMCGNNTRLFKKIRSSINDPLLIPLKFTPNVKRWMYAADVFITKAGGLSSTEAATLGLPIVLVNAVPGLEEHNLKFFVENGYGVTAEDIDGICAEADRLCSDGASRERITKRQREAFGENAAEKVANYILQA